MVFIKDAQGEKIFATQATRFVITWLRMRWNGCGFFIILNVNIEIQDLGTKQARTISLFNHIYPLSKCRTRMARHQVTAVRHTEALN